MEYHLVKICGHQLLFCKLKICRRIVKTYAINLQPLWSAVLYRHFYILFIIISIATIYALSMKSSYSYLNISSIMLPITSPYRLTIVSLYRHLYTFCIQITYNITYKGALYFGIPSVLRSKSVISRSGGAQHLLKFFINHNNVFTQQAL